MIIYLGDYFSLPHFSQSVESHCSQAFDVPRSYLKQTGSLGNVINCEKRSSLSVCLYPGDIIGIKVGRNLPLTRPHFSLSFACPFGKKEKDRERQTGREREGTNMGSISGSSNRISKRAKPGAMDGEKNRDRWTTKDREERPES